MEARCGAPAREKRPGRQAAAEKPLAGVLRGADVASHVSAGSDKAISTADERHTLINSWRTDCRSHGASAKEKTQRIQGLMRQSVPLGHALRG